MMAAMAVTAYVRASYFSKQNKAGQYCPVDPSDQRISLLDALVTTLWKFFEFLCMARVSLDQPLQFRMVKSSNWEVFIRLFF
jgi:hypothetical protein